MAKDRRSVAWSFGVGKGRLRVEPGQDIGFELLTAAWRDGTSERILAEVPGPKEPLPVPRLLQHLRKAIMNSATQARAQSKLNLDNPLLKVALTLATKLKERSAPPKPERLSPDQAIRHVIDQVVRAGGVASGPVVDSYEI